MYGPCCHRSRTRQVLVILAALVILSVALQPFGGLH